MEKTFDDWKERSDKINSLLETMSSAPTISTWLYLNDVVEFGESKKDENKTELAKAIIGNLVELEAEVKKQIEQVKVYWEDPEYIQLFKEADEELGGGMSVTTNLPNLWNAWLDIEQNGLKELQELYKEAFGEDK